ncbi:MAG: hypothetical protein WC455_13630 [Dehalococcoidia bacterium]|jgi:hypothetical protein
MAPYVRQVQQEEKKRISLLQPVQWIFDLLQRGQYLTANVGEEIIKSVRTGEPLGQAARDAISAAFEGLTGRRKGTWSTVLFGGKVDKAEPGMVQQIFTGERPTGEDEDYNFEGLFPDSQLPKWAKKVIGFAADVALDPTTYISFGATSAARAGAKKYASDSVEIFLKSLGEEATLKKVAGTGVGRAASQVYKKAYREALDTIGKGGQEGSEILLRNLTDKINEIGSPLIQKMDDLGAKLGPEKIADEGFNKLSSALDSLNEIANRLNLESFGKPGERALKLGPLGFGKELFKHEVTGAELAARGSWGKMKEMFANTPVGSSLGNAWYALNSTGPLGNLRDILGIRDPFGKFINELNVDSTKRWQAASNSLKKNVWDTVEGIPTEMREQVRDVLHLSDVITRGMPEEVAQKVTPAVILTNLPEANYALIDKIAKYDIRQLAKKNYDNLLKVVKDPNLLLENVTKVENLTNSWVETMNVAVSLGIIDDFSAKGNYLPNIYTDIGTKPSRMQKISGAETYGQEVSYLQWLLGVGEDEAAKMIKEKGAGVVVRDLETMLMYRAEAQSKLMSRIGVLEDFKKFGIPEADIVNNPLLRGRLGRTPIEGMTRVEGKMFKQQGGMYFPDEVADIFKKIDTYTKDPGLKTIKKMWNSFTGWWKGFATISTGFHVRNGIQNEMTGWMKHGMGWFSPIEKSEAIAATIYALAKDNPRPLLEKLLNGNVSQYQKLLAKRIGPYSVKELADIASKRVLSRTTLGFDASDFMDVAKGMTAKNLNPMSRGFAGMRGSRIIGEYLENGAKMQSFLMDFKSAMGKNLDELKGKMDYIPWDTYLQKVEGEGAEQVKKVIPYTDSELYKKTNYAIEWAKDETRKWYFEYDDLTDVEKKLFRNVIPFYAWMRKNIPHQLAVIFSDPSIYAVIPKAEQALTGTEVDESIIPEWMRAAGSIPFAKDKSGNPIMWIPNLGYSDLNKIPLMFGEGGIFGSGIHVTGRELIDDIVSSAHPMLKQIVQMVPEKGYDVFYRKDLDYNAKAPYLLRYFTKVPVMMEVMDGIARILGREEGLGFVVDDQGQLRMNGKIAKLLEDNLPVLRSMERVMYLGEAAIPGLDKAIEGATGAKDTHEGLAKFFQLLSYWGGLKFSPVDLNKAKQDVAADIYEKATEKRKKTEAYTPLAKARSLKASKASETKYRRVGL